MKRKGRRTALKPWVVLCVEGRGREEVFFFSFFERTKKRLEKV